MKTVIINSAQVLWLLSPFSLLASVRSSCFNDSTFQRFNVVFASLPRRSLRRRRVRLRPTQSDPVQPNQATPPPPGKQIGKETVKFLAFFDHHGRDDFHVVPIPKHMECARQSGAATALSLTSAVSQHKSAPKKRSAN